MTSQMSSVTAAGGMVGDIGFARRFERRRSEQDMLLEEETWQLERWSVRIIDHFYLVSMPWEVKGPTQVING